MVGLVKTLYVCTEFQNNKMENKRTERRIIYVKYFKDYKNVHYYCFQVSLDAEVPVTKILDVKWCNICTNKQINNKCDINKEVAFSIETQENLDLLNNVDELKGHYAK